MRPVCSSRRLSSIASVIAAGEQSTPRFGPSTVIPHFEARKNWFRRPRSVSPISASFSPVP